MKVSERDGILLGTGAGLTLVVLLVSQSLAGSVLVSTKTVTSATTVSATSIGATASSTAVSSIVLHRVTFNESAGCNGGYANKWAVTLGNITLKQPSNMTESAQESGEEIFGRAYVMISTIVFTVPNGVYSYNTSSNAQLFPYSGTVDVNGSDIVVQLEAEPTCIT